MQEASEPGRMTENQSHPIHRRKRVQWHQHLNRRRRARQHTRGRAVLNFNFTSAASDYIGVRTFHFPGGKRFSIGDNDNGERYAGEERYHLRQSERSAAGRNQRQESKERYRSRSAKSTIRNQFPGHSLRPQRHRQRTIELERHSTNATAHSKYNLRYRSNLLSCGRRHHLRRQHTASGRRRRRYTGAVYEVDTPRPTAPAGYCSRGNWADEFLSRHFVKEATFSISRRPLTAFAARGPAGRRVRDILPDEEQDTPGIHHLWCRMDSRIRRPIFSPTTSVFRPNSSGHSAARPLHLPGQVTRRQPRTAAR